MVSLGIIIFVLKGNAASACAAPEIVARQITGSDKIDGRNVGGDNTDGGIVAPGKADGGYAAAWVGCGLSMAPDAILGLVLKWSQNSSN